MDLFMVIFAVLLLLVASFLQHTYSYWPNRGIPQYLVHFIFGNYFSLNSMHLAELLHNIYGRFKGKTKLVGTYIYTKPVAVVLDLDLVKSILIKDFNKFLDRSEYRNDDRDIISAHLFQAYGEKWRRLRAKLTPTFTSGKMKAMFPTVVEVSKELEQVFGQKVDQSLDAAIEVHDFAARFTTDVIGQCAFGLECNSLKDVNAEFRRIGRLVFNNSFSSVRWRIFQETYYKLFRLVGFKRHGNTVEQFIMRVVHDTIAARESLNIQRSDFLNLLIELRNCKDLNGMPGLTIEEIAAQTFIFFAAGFETSSSNMSYGLYELAKNPQIQEKARNEVLSVLKKHNGEFTYDAMMEMTYLDQIISETLRKYPALANLTRIANVDYAIPGTKLILPKDTRIYIPVKELHNDPDIYDNPTEFRPERFDAEQIKLRHPQSFLGFGDGPRNCIGLRFGRMQVRVGFATLLKAFRFTLHEQTPAELVIGRKSIVMVPAHGVVLKAQRL